jgi:RsiW-degrading membrane proteinase PrsW (M82 family)
MKTLLFAILGIAPSLLWLLFYLHKDSHPEPKKTILLVFLGGALMGPVALLLQVSAASAFNPSASWQTILASLSQNSYLFFLNVLAIAPISEELLKYLVVRWQVLKDPSFDEPLDAMIYLIVSALGFAATENLLTLFLSQDLTIKMAFSQALARFLSATFLHTLASGTLGYFVACSLLNLKHRSFIFLTGLSLAVILHSFYNYLAWRFTTNDFFALIIAFLLIAMAGLVNWQFRYLKKQLSICKIR